MWEQIRSNRLRSGVLVFGMGLLLLAIGYAIGLYFLGSAIGGLVIAAIVWGVMGLIAYFQGDSILLGVSGARKINKTDDPRLFDVVEEMSIAAGLPKTPDVYVIEDPALNAFSTGRDPNKCAVAITSGLRGKLNRDELQGVMGHEIGHIKNRDVLLMAMAAVFLGAIVILSWYASRAMFFTGGRRRDSRDNGGGGQAILLILGLVLIILAPIFAQLIYFAISRRREYLADASSALYTRYPEGLASALEKLEDSTPLRAANQATAPMYIINPLHKGPRTATDWLGTHPPIAERVRILRSMGGGSALANYEQAYQEVHGKGGIIPKSALGG